MTNSPDSSNYAVLQVRSSQAAASPLQNIDCQVSSIHGKRVSIVALQRVAVSMPVSMEYNDSLLLGEVVACTQSCDEKWHLELKLEQVLTGLQSLMILRQRLLCEAEPSRSAPAALAVGQA